MHFKDNTPSHATELTALIPGRALDIHVVNRTIPGTLARCYRVARKHMFTHTNTNSTTTDGYGGV